MAEAIPVLAAQMPNDVEEIDLTGDDDVAMSPIGVAPVVPAEPEVKVVAASANHGAVASR